MEKRIAQLEKIIRRQQFIEDRYEELMLSCRRCWRYYGADQELFTASMKAMNFLMRRHATEIDEMNAEGDDLPYSAGIVRLDAAGGQSERMEG